ncbi:DNA-binding transcriptional regulator YhcF (GntR family) [Paenibacillus wynnii]|nr:DNA-binding transcriptional regulator YhcF (GntR family) [Paenibacillus wynnii]
MMKVIRNDKRPIWQQLLDQAIYNITSGVWAPGELLIPTRELAHIVGVSRSTIQIVYEELLSRGYTVTSRRGGTRVTALCSNCCRRGSNITPPTAHWCEGVAKTRLDCG